MYKIIIVDDEKLLRQGFIHMTGWKDKQFEIAGEASDGVQALELIEVLKPEIVVTDIRMPRMDGIELTRIIKEKYPHTQVIILSSYNDFDYVRETLKLGAFDYVLKPRMDTSEMLACLEKAVEKYRQVACQSDAAPDGYLKTQDVLEYDFYNDGTLTFSEDYTSSISAAGINYKSIAQYLELFEFDAIVKEVSDTIDTYLLNGNHIHPDYLKSLFIEVYDFMLIKLNEFGFDIQELNMNKHDCHRQLKSSSSCKDLLKAFKEIISGVEHFAFSLRANNFGYTLNQVMSFIHENYKKDIALSDVAEHFHINKSYLCQLFKKKTGESFNDILTAIRINKAKELLRTSDESIGTIGKEVGFSNPSYFAKVFKQLVGLNPTEYTRIYGKNQ